MYIHVYMHTDAQSTITFSTPLTTISSSPFPLTHRKEEGVHDDALEVLSPEPIAPHALDADEPTWLDGLNQRSNTAGGGGGGGALAAL